jgi:hypothetical protein
MTQQQIQTRITRALLRLAAAEHPVLAFHRACRKVGYMARHGRPVLFPLESALNELKHAHSLRTFNGHSTPASERHTIDAERDLQLFVARMARLALRAG